MRGAHGNHARGPRAGRWNEGRLLSAEGYVKVRVGKGHPLADPNGYAYEHLVVWIAAGNDRPGPDEVLHHRNEVRTDNRIENLERLSRSDHNREHIAKRERCATSGQLLPLKGD